MPSRLSRSWLTLLVVSAMAAAALLGWRVASPSRSGGPAGGYAGAVSAAPTPTAAVGTAPAAADPGAATPITPAGSTPAPAEPAAAGLEVLPSPSTGPAGGNPYLPELASLQAEAAVPVVARAPRTASATGRLVAGFPADLAPPTSSKVESSSLTVSGRRVSVALVARSSGAAEAAWAYYRSVLTRRGFAEIAPQGVENTPTIGFTRGDETVTISWSDGRLSLLGHLVAARR